MISEECKIIIGRLRNFGMKWKDISDITGHSEGACKMAFVRKAEVAELGERPVIKKRKTDGPIGRTLKEIIKNNPKVPYRDLPALLKDKIGDQNISISASTCRRYLTESGFVRVKLLKKISINEINQRKRMEFCQIMLPKDQEFWNSIIWSDETTVRQAPKGKDLFYYVHQSTTREEMDINPQIHSGGFSVMFWGCFSALGLGPLVALDGTMNAESYVELLQEYVVPELEAAGRPMRFMQDNAPCHTAGIVKDFFRRKQIPVLDWPPQSPDMNPIENLWAVIKHRRQKKYGTPSSKDELIEQVFDIWTSVEDSLISALANSANSRIAAVLKAKGKNTKY
jgi:transposase